MEIILYRKINDLLRERPSASATEMVRQAGGTIEAILRETEAVRTLIIIEGFRGEIAGAGEYPRGVVNLSCGLKGEGHEGTDRRRNGAHQHGHEPGPRRIRARCDALQQGEELG
jgi:hypothetical protein